jgi:TolA-binding protein
MNCTVQFKDGAATVWASTQVPSIARGAVARVLGIASDKVDVQVQFLGGGFGRRLDVDFIAQAAAIARVAEGARVQTLWSREQDMRHDFYRPACVAQFKAGFDANGNLTAWHNTSAGQAIIPQVLKREFGLPAAGPDKTTSEGAFDQPYEFPNAYLAAALANFQIKKLDAAEKMAREGLKVDTSGKIPRLHYLLGLTLAQKSDFKGAAESLRMYLQLAPTAKDADTAKKQLADIEKYAAATAAPPAPKQQ